MNYRSSKAIAYEKRKNKTIFRQRKAIKREIVTCISTLKD